MAMGLAREGVKLSICSRGEAVLNATADEIRRETGVDVLSTVADVSKPADVERLVDETIKRLGGSTSL